MIKFLKRFPITCSILGLISLVTAVFSSLFPILPGCYSDLSEMMGAHTLHVVLVVLMLTVGYGLHHLRKQSLILYAVTEISFAIASSWHAVDYLMEHNGLMASVPVVAAIYIFVRGLANLEEARTPSGKGNIHLGGVS